MRIQITEYGAIADGKTLCSPAIQAAIDECAGNGGGTVEVPAGCYKTGTIWLKSHVELHMCHGATLLASENLADYNEEDDYPQNWPCPAEEWCGKHLIICHDCVDVAITGTGTFDGNGEAFLGEPRPVTKYGWAQGIRKSKNETRPGQMMVFADTDDIVLQDFRIVNGTCWCVYLTGCVNASIRGLRIFNHIAAANTDGIDIDLSRNVTISDCIIDTGDDCITFRCSRGEERNRSLRGDLQQTEYVTVTNCVLGSSASVFRIGVGSDYIRHVRVSNIVIHRGSTAMNFMSIYAKKGGSHIEDVSFDHISVENVAYLMRITGGSGYIRQVALSNCRARIHGSIVCKGPWTAEDGKPGIQDVSISNLDLTFEDKFPEITEKMKDDRGHTAMTFEGIEGLTLDKVVVHPVPSTWDQVVSWTDSHEIRMRDCIIPEK